MYWIAYFALWALLIEAFVVTSDLVATYRTYVWRGIICVFIVFSGLFLKGRLLPPYDVPLIAFLGAVAGTAAITFFVSAAQIKRRT